LKTTSPGSSKVAMNTIPGRGFPDEARQCALAILKRRVAQVAPVELEEVKGA
jgi:hypothetical protein